jgi:hypothetical protein
MNLEMLRSLVAATPEMAPVKTEVPGSFFVTMNRDLISSL